MSASSASPLPSPDSTISDLEDWSQQLRSLAKADPDTVVDPVGQLAVENSIAAGVAVLAGEPLPEPSTEQSGRAILARDMLITTDLVLRALKAAAVQD